MSVSDSLASRDPETTDLSADAPPAREQIAKVRFWRNSGWFNALLILVAIYLFVGAINLMGSGLKTMARVPETEAWLHYLFSYARHPVAGLCIGVLITALVQSSSFTTCFVVGLVASPVTGMSLAVAIPIIMGANIGTSVTNTLVSLAHLRRRKEFQRSLAGALVHDIFNVLNAALLLPLEIAFGLISRPAKWFADWLEGAAFFTANPKQFNVVKTAVSPLTDGADGLLSGVLGLSPTVAGALTAIAAVALLFCALIMLVRMLQGLMRDRLAGLFQRTLFRNKWIAFVVGILITATVQSSSVTTSLIVPMVGAGVLTLKQIYPYTLGANIGTTITAILAGLAAAAMAGGQAETVQFLAAAGLAVAFGHLLFNIIGTCIFWPLSWIPISLAKGYAKLAARRRLLAGMYIVVIFFLVPLVVIFAVRWLG